MGKLGEEEEPATDGRRDRIRVRLGRERRASRLPCLSIGLGGNRRSTSRSGDVSLAIFITSVSGSESLTSFTNRFFHLSRPPGFRRAFDAAEGNGKYGPLGVREVKRAAAEERDE